MEYPNSTIFSILTNSNKSLGLAPSLLIFIISLTLSGLKAINQYNQKQSYLYNRLLSATRHKLEYLSHKLLNNSQTLHAVSPLATLKRGYSLTTHELSGQIIQSSSQLQLGDRVKTRLAEGSFISQVAKID